MELAVSNQHRLTRFVQRRIIIRKDLSVMMEQIIHIRYFNVGFINTYVSLYIYIYELSNKYVNIIVKEHQQSVRTDGKFVN
jgi:hypothetical protein